MYEVEQLLLDLHSWDKNKKRTAALKLGIVGGHKAVIALQQVLINDQEDGIVQSNAALMLGKLRHQGSVPLLIKALGSKGHRTPINAAIALGKIGGQPAIDALTNICVNHPFEDDLKKEVVSALEKLGVIISA